MKKGGEWEDLLEGWLDRASQGRIAPLDPPFQITKTVNKKKRIFQGFFRKQGVLDFMGSHEGWHVEIDAKQTKQNRFPFDHIQKSQWNRAMRLMGDHAAVALAVRFRGDWGDQDRIFMVPMRVVLAAQANGRKSITPKVCERYLWGADPVGGVTEIRYGKSVTDLITWLNKEVAFCFGKKMLDVSKTKS